MPYTSYKKTKNSKNSKSGGRRRKHTMRKYRRWRKVMRGGDYKYEPDGEFIAWWGQEQGKMSWDDFLNWYTILRCGDKTTGVKKTKLTEGTVFESWVNKLPSKVYSELRKAFGIDGTYDHYQSQWIGALYREMTRGNPDFVMIAAAANMNRHISNSGEKNYKIYEMLHRLYNKTWYTGCA